MIRLVKQLGWSLFLLPLLASTAAVGQSLGGFGFMADAHVPPKTELVVARLKYGTNGRKGHRGWSHNYPGSDQHINSFLQRSTRIDVLPQSYRIVELGSDAIFDYPFAYVSEPGEMLLTDEEVINLREYISRGGTMIMDDFDGTWQWNQMESQMLRAFPSQRFEVIEDDHLLFSLHENLENLQAMSNYVPGGSITYYGLYTEDGHLGVMAGHNNDLANFWDWYGNGSMPLKPSTDAFRLGANAIMYSLTR